MPRAAFSRPSSPGIFGKGTQRVEIALSENGAARLSRLARFEGKAAATWARERLEIAILIEEERVRQIVGGEPTPVNPEKTG